MEWRPGTNLEVLKVRARILQNIRAFFGGSDCLEVSTPLLSQASSTDVFIESITAYHSEQTFYLQTSPEFAMKRLLAAGFGSIYQICPAFRAEESGRKHRPEFTLLEWYRIGFDYQSLMDDVESLIKSLQNDNQSFERIRYYELFDRYLGFKPELTTLTELRLICTQTVSGIDSRGLDYDQCLNLLLSVMIEPQMRGYQFVMDYPANQASLSKLNKQNPVIAERFELFYNGMELANGFSELTDPVEQRMRFEKDNKARRENDQPVIPIDEPFLSALEAGLPECAGVAVGIDRLVMALIGSNDIREVMAFSDMVDST
ncbi:MAG: lysyl-tRNA synthetase class 2 [Gammaproteobacteria bacterium]|jgi:lysyl-tRNA synthetase class 2